MPIKSLQESYEFGSGLPEIARIRKGAAKTGNRPGADLVTHFRVTMSPGFEKYLPTFQNIYGENPEYFAPVRFGGATVEDVFDYWNRGYTATKLLHKCDGETQARHFDVDTGAYSSEPIACESPTCGCKNTGKIKLFLPKLIEETGIFGYVLMTTTSLHDIRNLLNCFRDMEHFAAMRGGDLSTIDFVIGRAPRIISVPNPQPKTDKEREKYREYHNGQDWKPGDRMNTSKGLLFIRPTIQYTKNVLLAAVDTKVAQLPAAVPAAPIAQLTKTNQPKVERRIGDKPVAPVVPPAYADEQDEEENEGSAPEFLPEFLQWIKKTFSNMREVQINSALELAPAWEHDIDVAKAAIIAFAMDYDEKLISDYTSGHSTIEVFDAAVEIVKQRQKVGAA